MSYAEYLEENFNVKIEFANYDTSGTSITSMVKYLCDMNVDVIINTYATSIPECLSICEEYDIYYLQTNNFPTDTDTVDTIKKSPYFLGYIVSDITEIAETTAKRMLNAGCNNISIVSMKNVFGLGNFHDVYPDVVLNTILEYDSNALAYDLRIPYFSIKEGLESLSLQDYEFDGFIASINTLFYSIDELKQMFGDEDIKFAYFGLDNNTRDAFLSGDLLMTSTGDHNIIGLAFAYAYHYITSPNHSSSKLELETNYIPLYSVTDYDLYIKTCVDTMPYSADELQSIIDSLDKDNELLHSFAKNYSLEDLIERNMDTN